MKKKGKNIYIVIPIVHYFPLLIFTVVGHTRCKKIVISLDQSGSTGHYGKHLIWFLLRGTKFLNLKPERIILIAFILRNWSKLYMQSHLLYLFFHHLLSTTVNILFLSNNGKLQFFVVALETSFKMRYSSIKHFCAPNWGEPAFFPHFANERIWLEAINVGFFKFFWIERYVVVA